MRGPLILSFLLHVAIMLALWLELPTFSDRTIQTEQVIEVTVVTALPSASPKPVAQPKQAPKPKTKPQPAEKEPPAPKPVKPAALPQPPPPPPPPEKAVAIREAPKPKAPESKPDPTPEVVKKTALKLPPRPRRKPKPPPEDEFASVLRTVEKLKNRPKPKNPGNNFDKGIEDILKKHVRKPKAKEPQQMSRLGENLSMSETDALKRQIEQCWNPPAGAPEAENLVVEVKLQINPDGTVMRAQIVDTDRMYRDSFYRSAAESVLRAINSPRCTPLRLPLGKYEIWKDTKITFDPRELVGR